MENGRGRKGQFLERCRCCEMQPPIARNRNGIFRFQENHSGLLRISQASTGASSGASLVREKRPLAYRISSHPVRAPHVAHVGGLRGVTCPQISQSPITTRSPPDHHPLSTRWPPVGHPRPSPLPSSGGLGQQGVNRFSRWRRVRKHSSIHGHLSRIGRFSVLNYESISDDFYLSIFLFRFKIFLEISDAVDGNPLGKCSRDAQRN